MSVSVCVFICPRSCLRDHTSDLYRIFCACYFCDRGSVLLWRRREMFCSSGFMDDVIFAHKPTLLDVAAGKSGTPDAIRLIAGGLSYKFGVPLCAWLKQLFSFFIPHFVPNHGVDTADCGKGQVYTVVQKPGP